MNHHTSASDEGVRLRVSDDGHGIEPELTKHIFDPFFTTKGVGKGTGLGLAMVRQIIENHRGTIDFESEKDVGTTFIINLPLRVKE